MIARGQRTWRAPLDSVPSNSISAMPSTAKATMTSISV